MFTKTAIHKKTPSKGGEQKEMTPKGISGTCESNYDQRKIKIRSYRDVIRNYDCLRFYLPAAFAQIQCRLTSFKEKIFESSWGEL